MVRLMLVLAPVMCILGGIGASALLLTYMKQIESGKVADKKSKKFESNYVLRSEVRRIINKLNLFHANTRIVYMLTLNVIKYFIF